jgi:hypothetical protein
MYTLVPAITARLRDALGACWHVCDGTLPHDRRPLPRAVVLMQAPDVSTTSGPGVSLAPRYVVQLAASAEATAFAQLDAAFDAVIARLHHWRPEGFHVARLQLQAARDLQAIEQELFGFELLFTTNTTRMGCDA